MSDQAGWRASRWKRVQAAVIAGLGYPLCALLGRTYRWRVAGLEHIDAILSAGQQPIMGFWHGRILPATYYFRNRGIAVITSENFDGEWIARIIERFGFLPVRGSSSRGAARALLQLLREVGSGHPAGFTLDGPRGPRYVAQPGAVWLASTTGNPLLPFHIEAARHWTARSWDLTQIPKPFSLVAIAVGAPVAVARDASDEVIERARADLERILASLEEQALGLLAGPRRP